MRDLLSLAAMSTRLGARFAGKVEMWMSSKVVLERTYLFHVAPALLGRIEGRETIHVSRT